MDILDLIPVLPEPAIRKVELAHKLGVGLTKLQSMIDSIPYDVMIYEDEREVGRLK